MAFFLFNDNKYRDLIYDNDGGSRRSDSPQSSGDYRFGRARGKPAHRPLSRGNGAFRRMVEAIADSKLRRMERELALRGVRPPEND
jgi:hypothetical protein